LLLEKAWAYLQKHLTVIGQEAFPNKDVPSLMNAKSNAGFHYLGCGKMFVQIGEAFAKAMPKYP